MDLHFLYNKFKVYSAFTDSSARALPIQDHKNWIYFADGVISDIFFFGNLFISLYEKIKDDFAAFYSTYQTPFRELKNIVVKFWRENNGNFISDSHGFSKLF
jgi:hypothetical protein